MSEVATSLELLAPNAGFAFLLLVAILGFLTPAILFFYYKRQVSFDALVKIAFYSSSLIFISAVISQISLIYSFIISDYSVSNVYYNSHKLKPLIYKISGSWGNHEGSMLMLITIIAGYSLAFNLFSKSDNKYKILVQSSQSIILALFASYTAFASSPFTRIFPEPNYGLELNPLLQDIGLALHPPMLYIGYIGFSLVFSVTIAALLQEKIDRNFVRITKNWLYFSWSFLTLGIGLGSWWAYRELGWGGFWFWDPVENVSIMPWLAGITLIHCLMMLEKKQIFPIWSVFLAILSFILCLLGIFLVRSGVLTSVHSFAVDEGRGFFIIALISIIGVISLAILGVKQPKISKKSVNISFFTKQGSILINNYILVIMLFVVVLGTIYPIFSQLFFDQFISIGPDYYNKISTILIIPFLLFLALTTQQSFTKSLKFKAILTRKNIILVIFALILTFLTCFFEEKASLSQILIMFLAFLVILLMFFGHNFKKNITSNIAHISFATIVLGIVLSTSFAQVREANLKVGEELKIAKYNIKFESIDFLPGKNYIARQGNFEVYSSKKNIFIDRAEKLFVLKPQLRYYPIADQTTNEADIKTSFFGDLYLVIGNKDESENYAVRVYYKPFIYLIWLGCFLLFGSIIYRLINIFKSPAIFQSI